MEQERSSLFKGLALGVGLMLLMAASIGGTVYVMRPDPDSLGAGGPGQPGAAVPEEPVKVFYHPIDPEFVVNLPGSGRTKFLMVEMSVATSDEKALDIIKDNAPELRNDLLMMLSEEDEKSLSGNEGKLALRERASAIVDELVAKHYAPDRVLDVYLTRFVIQ